MPRAHLRDALRAVAVVADHLHVELLQQRRPLAVQRRRPREPPGGLLPQGRLLLGCQVHRPLRTIEISYLMVVWAASRLLGMDAFTACSIAGSDTAKMLRSLML